MELKGVLNYLTICFSKKMLLHIENTLFFTESLAHYMLRAAGYKTTQLLTIGNWKIKV